ncbi:hypothetical protein B0T24DRAFT_625076 [Lasiosphaeria ovina]|uniref:Uncharacterized protein n=1 Tax=Lasiosphaeria ovina TaxID=92902 RepID=A0AAE0KD33_9PEZI|nr:hypothetical protein B0T24DRAFT_625076 [Lasiosphaeria ovina]
MDSVFFSSFLFCLCAVLSLSLSLFEASLYLFSYFGFSLSPRMFLFVSLAFYFRLLWGKGEPNHGPLLLLPTYLPLPTTNLTTLSTTLRYPYSMLPARHEMNMATTMTTTAKIMSKNGEEKKSGRTTSISFSSTLIPYMVSISLYFTI